MNWTESNGEWIANSQGLEFVLQPTDWSIWDLDQAKDSARHLANLKQCGLNPWCPGSTVKLFYRPDQAPPGKIKRR